MTWLLLGLLACPLRLPSIWAADNDLLNPTFGSRFGPDGLGIAPISPNFRILDLIVQPKGQYVVVVAEGIGRVGPDFIVARYNSDGSPDQGFGTNGRVTTDFRSQDNAARAVAIQPDGKIVVVGYASKNGDRDFAVARYLPDGRLDTRFDGDGKVTTDLEDGAFADNSNEQALAVALQFDGKIVVVGKGGLRPSFALARLPPDGLFDDLFGDNDSVVDSMAVL